jgi:hypothetical protein
MQVYNELSSKCCCASFTAAVFAPFYAIAVCPGQAPQQAGADPFACTSSTHLSSCTATCQPGYTSTNASLVPTATCTNGSWVVTGSCGKSCAGQAAQQIGAEPFACGSNAHLSSCRATCQSGYAAKVSSPPTATCVDGNWQVVGECEPKREL